MAMAMAIAMAMAKAMQCNAIGEATPKTPDGIL